MNRHPNWPVIAASCSFAVILAVVVWKRRRSPASELKKQPSTTEVAKEVEIPRETSSLQNNVNKKEVKPREDDSPQNNVNKKEVKPRKDDSPQNNVNKKEVKSGETDSSPNNVNKKEVKERPKSNLMYGLYNPKWVKVGQVQELYLYPLKSGRGRDAKECFFSEFGISLMSKGRFTMRDGMFLVYNEETLRSQTSKDYPTLILVSMSSVDEFKVKLEAVGMPSVIFAAPKDSKEKCEALECKIGWGESVKCIDCGQEPAEWLSRFLTGTNSGLRLGYTVADRKSARKAPWEKHDKTYEKMRLEDADQFRDLMSYMLVSSNSLEKLDRKQEGSTPAIQYRPNILISGSDPFAEDRWEWIKIGERAIIRNIKTSSKTREEVGGESTLMGIFCSLYLTGKVRVGDDVFVHTPENPVQFNHNNATTKSQPT